MVEMISMVKMRSRRGREFETVSCTKAYGPLMRLRLWEHSERGSRLKREGGVMQQRGGCYMRRAKYNIPSSMKATGSFL